MSLNKHQMLLLLSHGGASYLAYITEREQLQKNLKC